MVCFQGLVQQICGVDKEESSTLVRIEPKKNVVVPPLQLPSAASTSVSKDAPSTSGDSSSTIHDEVSSSCASGAECGSSCAGNVGGKLLERPGAVATGNVIAPETSDLVLTAFEQSRNEKGDASASSVDKGAGAPASGDAPELRPAVEGVSLATPTSTAAAPLVQPTFVPSGPVAIHSPMRSPGSAGVAARAAYGKIVPSPTDPSSCRLGTRDEILPGASFVELQEDILAAKRNQIMQQETTLPGGNLSHRSEPDDAGSHVEAAISPELKEQQRFLSNAVDQADDVHSNFAIQKTLGVGSYSRIRLALLQGNFNTSVGSFEVGNSSSSTRPKNFRPETVAPLVADTKDGQVLPFALKILRKSDIVMLKQEEHTVSERDVLGILKDHPFIVTLHRTYQDARYLYMLLEYVPGGEIFTMLRLMGRFPKDLVYFYACQLVLTFEHMHRFDIAYRDTKSENLLIDASGYLRVVDFGFAKQCTEKTYTICGTPEYLAPEILLNLGHDKRVDWWSFGIFLYEMLVGTTPFVSGDITELYRKILDGEVDAWGADVGMVQFEEELILALLVASPDQRLGSRDGAADVKAQNYFFETPWDYILRKEIPAPYVPELESVIDARNFQEYPDSVEAPEEVAIPDDLFEGFENF
ncbi:unnamed protein product [Amoebophrya sp. A25]|nr:unnamed protein product [Amoebophrya sp. A25]|eukprot:GSA25T00024733001.1